METVLLVLAVSLAAPLIAGLLIVITSGVKSRTAAAVESQATRES